MPSYEVVKPCYVTLGRGLRYTPAGKIVTLEVEEAEKLDGYVRPLDQETVRIPDTEPDTEETVRIPDSTPEQEVTEDAGEQSSVDEGTAGPPA